MTTPAIDIRSLRVDYGDFVAVDDLSLTVPPGEVFGLVGPNGAGKTSTFRVITTLMEPTYGEVILDGDIRQACQGHNVAPDGGKNNPYTVDHKNHPGLFNASGHIGLLGHGAGIMFRNIRIKELPAAKTKK